MINNSVKIELKLFLFISRQLILRSLVITMVSLFFNCLNRILMALTVYLWFGFQGYIMIGLAWLNQWVYMPSGKKKSTDIMCG